MKTWFAAAAILTLTACAAQPPARLVVSPASPALTLRIDPAFAEVTPLRFPIEKLTDAERRIFVEADAERQLRRMIVVQFEKVQPGSDFRFVFRPTPPRRFGAETYRAGAFAYDDAAAAIANPGREADHTRRHLGALGYRSPRVWKVARLARVSDPQGLSEVILFYMEAADTEFPGETAADDIALSAAESERLLRALEGTVHAVRG